MPQFDTTFFSAQIFWTIISFVVLFAVLSRWILPRITSILQQRAQLIEDEIAAAHKRHQEADSLKNEYVSKLSGIEQESKKIFAASERHLNARQKQMMIEWNNEMDRKKRTFREDTEIMRQQAIRDVRIQSAELIAAATERLIHQKVGTFEAQQILEETIAELEKTLAKQK
ncbi:MAG: ATP synthase F0 subunit B [Mariprofundaceae bacterium]|nr:ATP synthase F0 subunit B [Mariprofundaceae bacterium]